MDKLAIGGLACLLVIVLVALWWVVGGFILMLAWNAVLPYLIGAPAITHGHGIAIIIGLSIIGGLFKSSYTAVSK